MPCPWPMMCHKALTKPCKRSRYQVNMPPWKRGLLCLNKVYRWHCPGRACLCGRPVMHCASRELPLGSALSKVSYGGHCKTAALKCWLQMAMHPSCTVQGVLGLAAICSMQRCGRDLLKHCALTECNCGFQGGRHVDHSPLVQVCVHVWSHADQAIVIMACFYAQACPWHAQGMPVCRESTWHGVYSGNMHYGFFYVRCYVAVWSCCGV